MNAGDLELVLILGYWAAAAPAATAVVRLDERRLRPEQLARAWPPVSRDAALFAMWMFGFHPVYLLAFFGVHFVRTRGALVGGALAIAWTGAVFGLAIGAVWGLASWLGDDAALARMG